MSYSHTLVFIPSRSDNYSRTQHTHNIKINTTIVAANNFFFINVMTTRFEDDGDSEKIKSD